MRRAYNRILRKSWLLLSAALLLLGVAFVVEQVIYRKGLTLPQEDYQRIQQVINQKERDSEQLAAKIAEQTSLLEDFDLSLLKNIEEEHLTLHVYRHDSLIFWSDNKVEIYRDVLSIIPQGHNIVKTRNGWYQCYRHIDDDRTILLLYLIKSDFAFQNQYIQNRFNPEFGIQQEGKINRISQPSYHNIFDTQGYFLFSILLSSRIVDVPMWLSFLAGLGLILLILALSRIFRMMVWKWHWVGFIGITGVMLLIRVASIQYSFPRFLYDLPLFSPEIYASSDWQPSLGDLLINALLFLWLTILLRSNLIHQLIYKASNEVPSPRKQWVMSIVGVVSSLLLGHAVLLLQKSLVIDSSIPFDIDSILEVNYYTFIAILASGILFLGYFILFQGILLVLRKQQVKYRTLLLVAFTGLGIYAILQHWIFMQRGFFIFQMTGYGLLMVIFPFLTRKLVFLQRTIVVVVLLTVFSSISIYWWSDLKEVENRKLFASKLTSQNDIAAEYFFQIEEIKVANDKFIKEYFYNSLILKSQLEKRIKQLYFAGYLSKYDVLVFDFDTLGNSVKENNNLSYAYLDNLYEEQSVSTIDRYFRYIKSPAERQGYIAKYVLNHKHQRIGELFILLQPKLIQDENRFDELLMQGNTRSWDDAKGYSYAVYKNGRLFNQSGEYAYSMNQVWRFDDTEQYHYFHQNGFLHLSYQESPDVNIIVSRQDNRILRPLGTFSFIFTFYTFFIIALFALYAGINAISEYQRYTRPYSHFFDRLLRRLERALLLSKLRTLLFSTRVQVAMVLIVFVTLIITAYSTVSYISYKYNNQQNDKLLGKIRSVVNTVENEVGFEYEQVNIDELVALVNQAAEFYDTDISLYDRDGLLLVSTKNRLYESGIVSRRIHPEAFYQLKTQAQSQFIQNENIGNLNFLSAYVPILTNNRTVVGYLNVAYFAKEVELYDEISSFLVNFINLYVLFFVIVGLLAYFVSKTVTAPLTLIRDKMSKTRLDKANEIIEWERNDEIGELVNQYNKMIGELGR